MPGDVWDAWGRLGTPGDACSSTVLDGGQLMEIINPENGGFLYYVLIVNRAFSGLCWGDHREAFPRSLKIETGTPKNTPLSCSGAVLASENTENGTPLVFRRHFGELNF